MFFIQIDGETYVKDVGKYKDKGSKDKEEATITFKKYSAKKYEKLIDGLAEKISTKANVKEIVRQSLFHIPLQGILEIEKEMAKEKPKIRNNKGCFSMSVGKVRIPILD